MNPHTTKLLSLSTTILISITAAMAGDVDFYVGAKGQNLRQTNSGAPVVITSESPFRFVAEVLATDTNSVTNVIVKLPSKVSLTLTNQAGEEEAADFAYETGFTNKTLLDKNFAGGTYAFIIRALNDGSNGATMTLPADAYPSAPHIANWNDAQEVESTQPFILRWDASTNIGSGDLVLLDVSETNGNPVLSTPGFFKPGALNGTNVAVLIDTNQLSPGQTYDARLLFVKINVRNTNSVPGTTGAGGYYRETKFPLVTLPDPGAASRVQLSSLNYSVGENDGSAVVTVTRVGDESNPVSVNLVTSDGTAVDGTNYLGVNTTLTFDPEVTSTNVIVPILNDFKATGNKSLNLWLLNLTGNAYLGNRSNALLTIVDAQKTAAGKLQFAKASNGVSEASAVINLTISRVAGTTGSVGVHFHTVDGSAQAGLDYIGTNGTIIIPAAKASAILPIRIINDSLNESNETFYVILDSTTGGASLGTNSVAKVNILDNDPGGVVSLGSASYTTNENSGFFLLTVKRTGTGTLASGASVDFTTLDGSAIGGQDYFATNGTLTFGSNELTKTISIAVTNDILAEGDENFFFHISHPQGGATLGVISNATLTIKDDESSISISNAVFSVSEAGPSVAVTLIRSGALLTSVSVDFATVNGSATGGLDYGATNGTVTFLANVKSKTIVIPINNDTIVEGDETFSFRISNPQGGVQFGATTNEIITIVDNDFPGTIQFATNSVTGTEGASASVTVTRTGGIAGGVTVNFTMSGGSATSGVDYTNVSGTLTFAAGETSKIILVPLIIDSLNESTETVNLTLSGATGGASLGSTSAATLNILNKPDPNAIPLNGPVFIKGTLAGSTFASMASSCIASSAPNSIFQVTSSWTTGSGLSTVINQMTIDVPRTLGTINF